MKSKICNTKDPAQNDRVLAFGEILFFLFYFTVYDVPMKIKKNRITPKPKILSFCTGSFTKCKKSDEIYS